MFIIKEVLFLVLLKQLIWTFIGTLLVLKKTIKTNTKYDGNIGR